MQKTKSLNIPVNKGQLRLLKYLHENVGILTRQTLSEETGITTGNCCNMLGPYEEEQRKVTEKRTGFPSLLTLGYVEWLEYEVDGKSERGYMLTEKGRKFIESIP